MKMNLINSAEAKEIKGGAISMIEPCKTIDVILCYADYFPGPRCEKFEFLRPSDPFDDILK